MKNRRRERLPTPSRGPASEPATARLQPRQRRTEPSGETDAKAPRKPRQGRQNRGTGDSVSIARRRQRVSAALVEPTLLSPCRGFVIACPLTHSFAVGWVLTPLPRLRKCDESTADGASTNRMQTQCLAS